MALPLVLLLIALATAEEAPAAVTAPDERPALAARYCRPAQERVQRSAGRPPPTEEDVMACEVWYGGHGTPALFASLRCLAEADDEAVGRACPDFQVPFADGFARSETLTLRTGASAAEGQAQWVGIGSPGGSLEAGVATFGAPRPVTRAGTPVIVGSLDVRDIEVTVRRHLNTIRYCYHRELADHPTLAGELTVRFVIGANGAVTSAEAKTSTLGNEDLARCVVGRFQRMQFPAPPGGGVVVVTYPLVFQPEAP